MNVSVNVDQAIPHRNPLHCFSRTFIWECWTLSFKLDQSQSKIDQIQTKIDQNRPNSDEFC